MAWGHRSLWISWRCSNGNFCPDFTHSHTTSAPHRSFQQDLYWKRSHVFFIKQCWNAHWGAKAVCICEARQKWLVEHCQLTLVTSCCPGTAIGSIIDPPTSKKPDHRLRYTIGIWSPPPPPRAKSRPIESDPLKVLIYQGRWPQIKKMQWMDW